MAVRITATADGNLKSNAERAVVIQSARISITKTGPTGRYVDQAVTWEIRVANLADVPVNNVVVRDQLPAEVAFTSATELGQFINGQVVWNVGTLPARGQKVVQRGRVGRHRAQPPPPFIVRPPCTRTG